MTFRYTGSFTTLRRFDTRSAKSCRSGRSLDDTGEPCIAIVAL